MTQHYTEFMTHPVQVLCCYKYIFFSTPLFSFNVEPHPFDALQVSFQQAVQGECDDIVHVLELMEGGKSGEKERGVKKIIALKGRAKCDRLKSERVPQTFNNNLIGGLKATT